MISSVHKNGCDATCVKYDGILGTGVGFVFFCSAESFACMEFQLDLLLLIFWAGKTHLFTVLVTLLIFFNVCAFCYWSLDLACPSSRPRE